MSEAGECVWCERSVAVRLRDDDVERLLAEYLRANPTLSRVDRITYERRLEVCRSCPDLKYARTTCRHCGCLVAVRAWVAQKPCPASPARWGAVVDSPRMHADAGRK